MTVKYPTWINKIEGAAQTPEEMNGLVEVLQNHAETLSLHDIRILAAASGIYTASLTPTSEVPAEVGDKVFLVTIPGTYTNFGNVILPENNFGFIFKNGNSFSIQSVAMPKQDMQPVNDAIDRMDEFLLNYEISNIIKQESENPINSVAFLSFLENEFWNYTFYKGSKEIEKQSNNGYFNNSGVLVNDLNGNAFKCEEIGVYNKIKVWGTGIFAVGDMSLSAIFSLNSTGVKTEIKSFTTTAETMDGVEFDIPTDAVTIFYNSVRKGATPQITMEPKFVLMTSEYLQEDSKAKTIDEILTPLYNLTEIEENSIISEETPNKQGYYKPDKTFVNENSTVRGFNYIVPNGASFINIKGVGFYSGGEGTLYAIKSDDSIVELEPKVSNYNTIDKTFSLNGVKEVFGTMVFYGGLTPKVLFLRGQSAEVPTPNNKKLEQYIKQIAGESSGAKVGDNLIVGKPNTAIEINFVTTETLPTAKPTVINGEVSIKIDDVLIKKYATLGVQGTSTAIYPKKNWSLALFNNEAKSSAFEMSIDGLPFHDEFVFKADWVDATNMRNLLCNRLWEQIIQSRKGFPKREFNEYIYNASDATFENRFPTRALGHVQGFPCIFKVNGEFYGVGCFNIGKKRQNYNLKKSNKKHIQLEDGSDGQRNLITWKANDWNVRNPSMTGYVEEGEIPDAIVKASVDRLFAYHGSGQTNMIANFEQYYTKKNIFDKIIFSQAIYDLDGVAKNYMLTTWDGLIWHHLPYDMDSVFGLNFNGLNYLPTTKDVFTHYESVGGEEQAAFLSGRNFYRAILTGYKSEINARYKELRDNDILSVDNLYKLAMEIHLKWGDENFKKEFEKWTDRPSNTIIKTSISQILKYMEDRFVWLDTYFNYIP
ncbi:CotH kinase family protein [Empedobacter falsenii]